MFFDDYGEGDTKLIFTKRKWGAGYYGKVLTCDSYENFKQEVSRIKIKK